MTENKRFTIKPQDDLFGVVDNYSPDKVCVINGIRTEIEAEWLCKDMNTLNDDNEQLRKEKINAEVKLYSANEKILMQMDYDEIIKQNTENEIEITNLKKENMRLKHRIKKLQNELNNCEEDYILEEYL